MVIRKENFVLLKQNHNFVLTERVSSPTLMSLLINL